MRSFAEIIDSRRRDKGLTVEQVFERLERYPWPKGVRPPALATVGHWFNGTRKRPRDMNHLRGLCDVLDLSIAEAMDEPSIEARTDLEQVILRGLRGIEPEDQELVAAMVESLKARRIGKGKRAK
jgi:transcriptional regulator with XRE-family HTH domain